MFVCRSMLSFISKGCCSSVTLYVDPLEETDEHIFEVLRRSGCVIEDYRGVQLDSFLDKQISLFDGGNYGKIPLFSDAYRYSVFSRREGVMWCDADSFCLKSLSGLPNHFVASEHARFAYPFRKYGLLDSEGFFDVRSNMKTWFSSAVVPRIVTNSHMSVTSNMGKELLSDLASVKNLQCDSGMTVLRKKVHHENRSDIVTPANIFNPIPSWRLDLFDEFLNTGDLRSDSGDASGDQDAHVVHVFFKIRKKLSLNWDRTGMFDSSISLV